MMQGGEGHVERDGDAILTESEICERYVLRNKWTCALQSIALFRVCVTSQKYSFFEKYYVCMLSYLEPPSHY